MLCQDPFFRGEEIYLMFQNSLWFSRKRDENFNFLRTYKMPKLDNILDFMPVSVFVTYLNFKRPLSELILNQDRHSKFNIPFQRIRGRFGFQTRRNRFGESSVSEQGETDKYGVS